MSEDVKASTILRRALEAVEELESSPAAALWERIKGLEDTLVSIRDRADTAGGWVEFLEQTIVKDEGQFDHRSAAGSARREIKDMGRWASDALSGKYKRPAEPDRLLSALMKIAENGIYTVGDYPTEHHCYWCDASAPIESPIEHIDEMGPGNIPCPVLIARRALGWDDD